MALPVIVINLAHHTHRRRELQAFLDDLKLQTIWIDAVDGEKLRQSQGRARHIGGGRVRFCWNTEDGRAERTFNLGNSFQKGQTAAWGMMACSMSHECLGDKGMWLVPQQANAETRNAHAAHTAALVCSRSSCLNNMMTHAVTSAQTFQLVATYNPFACLQVIPCRLSFMPDAECSGKPCSSDNLYLGHTATWFWKTMCGQMMQYLFEKS